MSNLTTSCGFRVKRLEKVGDAFDELGHGFWIG